MTIMVLHKKYDCEFMEQIKFRFVAISYFEGYKETHLAMFSDRLG